MNLKARTTNTLAAVRAAYWDYVYSIQAVDVASQSLSLASYLNRPPHLTYDLIEAACNSYFVNEAPESVVYA